MADNFEAQDGIGRGVQEALGHQQSFKVLGSGNAAGIQFLTRTTNRQAAAATNAVLNKEIDAPERKITA